MTDEPVCSASYGGSLPSMRPYQDFEEKLVGRFNEIRNTEYDRTFLDGVGFGVSPSGLGDRVYNPNPMNPAGNYQQNWKKTLYMMFNGHHIHTVPSSVAPVNAQRAITVFVSPFFLFLAFSRRFPPFLAIFRLFQQFSAIFTNFSKFPTIFHSLCHRDTSASTPTPTH